MPLLTPPAHNTPKSAYIQSRQVLDRIEAHSPGSNPSATSPSVTSRTAAPNSRHVVDCQMPKSFWRNHTASPRMRIALTHISAIVSPGTTMSRRGLMPDRSHSMVCPLTTLSPSLPCDAGREFSLHRQVLRFFQRR